jgi:lipopolysaccharide transport system permease protein
MTAEDDKATRRQGDKMPTQTTPLTTPLAEVLPPSPGAGADVIETVIGPPVGWQLINWGELWRFRELILILAWRDIKVRYKQTVLGAAWAILQPAMMMVVFTIFFGRLGGLATTQIPYAVFVYAGLLPWMFVSGAIIAASNSVLGSERLITKIYFPRLALPLSAVATALVDFCFAFGLLVVLMLCYGVVPGPTIVLAPLFLALLTLAALGAGILLSGLTVAYRDFRYVTPFMIQLWMFLTPAIYMAEDRFNAPDKVWISWLLIANPLNALIGAFRAACLGGDIAWGGVAVATALVAAMFIAGCLYFRKVEDGFADII